MLWLFACWHLPDVGDAGNKGFGAVAQRLGGQFDREPANRAALVFLTSCFLIIWLLQLPPMDSV